MRSSNPYYVFLDGAGQNYTSATSYQPTLGTGIHRVSVNAYDNSNNVIGSGDKTAYVDKTNPSGTLSVNKTTFAPNETIVLTISASDNDSGVKWLQAYYQGSWHSQDCSGLSSCTKSWSFSESSFGSFVYSGNIYDVANNGALSSPPTVTVNVVDTTPPRFTSFSVSSGAQWTNGNPTWSWSAVDDGVGMRSSNPYYVFLDGAGQNWTNATSYQPNLGTGIHRVSVNAYDNSNNVIGSGDLYAYVDKTAPTGTFTVNKSTFSPGETITLTLSANDSHSGIKWLQAYYQGSWHSQDCSGLSSCTKSWSFSESSFGSYTYSGNIYDVANNGSYSSPSTVTVNVIDNVAPIVSISGAPGSWQNTDATATVNCSDAGTGCNTASYRLRTFDSYPTGGCGNYTYYFYESSASPLTISSYKWVCAQANDNASPSNVGYSSAVEFKIDKTSPTGSLSVASASTGSTTVSTGETLNLTMTGSDNVGVNWLYAPYSGSPWYPCSGSQNCSHVWQITAPASPGVYNYTGTVYDIVGNVVGLTSNSIIVKGVSQLTGFAFNPNSIILGQQTAFGGTLTSGGVALNNRTVYLMVDISGTLQYVTDDLGRNVGGTTNASGYFGVNWTPRSVYSGTHSYRLYYPGDSDYLYTYSNEQPSLTVIVDTTPPTVSISGAPGSWQNTDATATVSCFDSGIGCDASSLRLRTNSSSFDCSKQEYWDCFGCSDICTNGQACKTISSDTWVCAAAKDAANIKGYSDAPYYRAIEFKVDKTKPNTPNIDSPACNILGCPTQSTNFTISVSNDGDSGGSGLNSCYYHVYDSSAGFTRSWISRICNSSFTVTVGEGKDCRTNNGTCSIYVASKDNVGNEGDSRINTYPIKWVETTQLTGFGFNPSTIALGERTAFGGTLKTATGNAIAGKTIYLMENRGGSLYYVTDGSGNNISGTTNSSGYTGVYWTPTASYSGTRYYRLYFAGDSSYLASQSAEEPTLTVSIPSLTYPSNYWQRIWHDDLGNMLGEDMNKNEPNTQFNNDWGLGQLAFGRADNIQFASSRTIPFAAGVYRFYLDADDGAILKVRDRFNNLLYQSNNGNWASGNQAYEVNLVNSDNYHFEIDYFEAGSFAHLNFRYDMSCIGSIRLNIDPRNSVPLGTVTLTVSNLNNCGGNTVKFATDENCSSVAATCQIGSEAQGCSSDMTMLDPRYFLLTTTDINYWACVDKDNNGSFSGSGETSSSKTLTVINSAVVCLADVLPNPGRCDYGYKLLSFFSTDSWVGLLAEDVVSEGWFGLPVNKCDDGVQKCELMGAPTGTNGQGCHLIDACSPGIGQLPYFDTVSGRYDASNSQCVSCENNIKYQRIMKRMPDNSSQRCYELKDGPGCNATDIERDWELYSCAYTPLANLNTCESACGAESVCDEKKPDMGDGTAFDTWQENGTIFKCDANCQKVSAEPPTTEIKETDPAPIPDATGKIWYNNIFKVRVEDKPANNLKPYPNGCRYDIFVSDPRGEENWEVRIPSMPRKCNDWLEIDVGSNPDLVDCYKNGLWTCHLRVTVVDNYNATAEDWFSYNIDYEPPAIEKGP
jgi:hypothetical protein